jgi:hypothetical protein
MVNRHCLARVLMRLYPSQWRKRYETEVLALVEDSGLTAPAALNLVAGACREWMCTPHRGLTRFWFVLIVAEGVNVSAAFAGAAWHETWTPPAALDTYLSAAPLVLLAVFASSLIGVPLINWQKPLVLSGRRAALLGGVAWLTIAARGWKMYALTAASLREHWSDVAFEASGLFAVLAMEAFARYQHRRATPAAPAL